MRYLSEEAKAVELKTWEATKADYLANPPTKFHGGHGYPDPEIFAWCDTLNAIEGVCTLQSCAGHRCTKESHCAWCSENFDEDEIDHVWNGQLWLWLDEIASLMFHKHAFELAAHPLIEKVSVHYHIDEKEIVDIVFKGTDQLDESMMVIMQFFSGIKVSSCK